MIVIVDNYDSFTYNLVQYFGEFDQDIRVFRNDAIDVAGIRALKPGRIIVSPGPCTPLEAGISNDVVRHFGGKIPILGVCLGHQCIGQVYGAKIEHAFVPTHGKSSLIYHDGSTIYNNIPNPFEGGRYHSLVVNWDNQPSELEKTATSNGVIMGIRHKEYVVEGVQFHPESIMTDVGHSILSNFLQYTRGLWEK